ncbi:MAG: HEAT repeat domain-containing protein [Deltaproteobacteria bacterium]|jgi:hypothetical protein|nr:HEAT repeat domain-containing protein [Deltaproteobacteria bacterium]MBW2536109.1 HEAT repeat domain-containing protein [Deltaproteobacteria bacterium]
MSLSFAVGCAVDQEDLSRWETTLEGPKRLRAVVLHDKYPHDLRVQAAMSLIRMKPRKGQRVGIKLLVEKTLAELTAGERGKLVASLVPLIMEELEQKAPDAQPGQPLPPDPSFKYKDAAYMMLTYDRTSEGTTIITDPELKKQLLEALTSWAMADFERRLNDRAQMYGMEQLLRYIGAPSVVKLPSLMTKNAKSLVKMADIVAKLGDAKSKEAAGEKLVGVAKYIASDQWRKDKKPELEEANRRAQIEPTEKQFAAQLERYQDESLLRVYGSMKKVGGAAVIEYGLKVAANKDENPKRRQAALAALEGRIHRDNSELIDRVLAIAGSDAPDIVLDQAFRRIRELPRDKVVEKLYGMFKTDKWKVRRAAAATVLQMSKVEDIDEFMKQLGRQAHKNLSLGEFLTYGALLGELEEGDPRKAIDKYLDRGPLQARLAAISYYFSFGTKPDLSKIQPLRADKEKIPECDEDAECGWECEVAKEGDPKTRETKQIETVGQYVLHCIEPQMEKNKPKTDKKKSDKDEDGKGKGDTP